MPAMLIAAALATGQPSSETVRPVDPAASTRIGVVQDLSAIVSGTAPFVTSASGAPSAGLSTGSVTFRQTGGAGIVSMSIDTGANSVVQAATAMSARLVLPDIGAARTALP